MSRYETIGEWEGLVVEGSVDYGPATRECPGWRWPRVTAVRLGGDPLPEALVRFYDLGATAGRIVDGYCRVMKELPRCAEDWLRARFESELSLALLEGPDEAWCEDDYHGDDE